MDYKCTLLPPPGPQAVPTKWEPDKPDVFLVNDSITFTSNTGDWRVEFADSPFQAGSSKLTLSAPIHQPRRGPAREGHFPFRCTLVVGGKTFDWGSGDDILVKR
ncbi:MAG: hypothetical protein KIT09_20420 [Bryobacteraceae bacterium]|nr:hypothetical protein [Bryobacteraceae bacterium]